MGTWVSACPANATSPIRSEERARTNSVAVRRATSSRLFGEKSSASMLLEISSARTIEMPSLRSSARRTEARPGGGDDPGRQTERPERHREPRDPQPFRGTDRGTHVAHRRAGETGKPLLAPPPPQRQGEEQDEQDWPRERHRGAPPPPPPPLVLSSRASARARAASGATSTPCAVANAT